MSKRPAMGSTRAGGSEDQHAAAFVEEFRMQHPSMAHLLIHIANEGGTRTPDGSHFAKLAKRKKMGVVPGVADYFLAYTFSDTHGLWLELKAPTGKLKQEQIAFLEAMNDQGYACVVAWGWEAALHVAGRYLRGNVDTRYVYGVPLAGVAMPLVELTQAGAVRAGGIRRTREEA